VHNQLLEEHHEGTGQWFLESNVFRQWRNNSASNLWIQGIRESSSLLYLLMLTLRVTAGNGKSVLWQVLISPYIYPETNQTITLPVLLRSDIYKTHHGELFSITTSISAMNQCAHSKDLSDRCCHSYFTHFLISQLLSQSCIRITAMAHPNHQSTT
jgi:hypothetical protein